MYQPSNSMPIENYSVVQPSTQQKTFTENNICRFSLPFTSIPFFDPHESYLQLNAKCNYDAKMELNGNSSVIIKYIRLSVNGQVLEEIDEFNQLAHIYNHYGQDDSSRSQESVFTLDSGEIFTTGLMGNQGGALANGVKNVKLIIPMKECGLFSSLEIVPLMAFGNNLDVEIRFAPDKEVLKTYARNGVNQALAVDTAPVDGRPNLAPSGQTKIKVSNATVNATVIGNAGNPFLVSLPTVGWTSVGDCPIQVGDKIALRKDADNSKVDATGDVFESMTVASVSRVATTALTDNPLQIQITISDNAGAGIDPTANGTTGANTAHLTLVKTVADVAIPAGTLTYSNVEWYIQKVVPPVQYVNSLTKQLQSPQGFQYDIHTWTTYKSTLLAGVESQTIEIPAYQSRAKSVLIVPRTQNQNVVFNINNDSANATYNYNGQFSNLRDYQWQVNNGLRVPTRPVNLDVMDGIMKHLSAEHLIQITQALGSSNIGVRNIKSSHDNFLIGRQLSKYGGTSRLTSAMRVYLNYQNKDGASAPTAGLQPITFINHINRVSVNTQGLQVFN